MAPPIGEVAADDDSPPPPLGLVTLDRLAVGESGGDWRLRKNLGCVGVEGADVVKRDGGGGDEAPRDRTPSPPLPPPTPMSSVENPPREYGDRVDALSHDEVNTNIASELTL